MTIERGHPRNRRVDHHEFDRQSTNRTHVTCAGRRLTGQQLQPCLDPVRLSGDGIGCSRDTTLEISDGYVLVALTELVDRPGRKPQQRNGSEQLNQQ